MTQHRLLLATFGLSFVFSLAAQSTLHIHSSCNWSGDEFKGEVTVFEPSNEAERIIHRVTDAMGLEPNFIIKSAAISNALATTENGQRYILYSTTFLENFKRDARTQWAAYCVLAHEIGHHLNNHNFMIDDARQRRTMELQADRFAGNILQKMGATLEEAQAGIETFRLAGETESHPSKLARSEAVANGWKAAQEGVKLKFEPMMDNEKLAKEWFDKGLAEKTDMNKKIEYYSKAIQYKPNYADAFINRGWAKNNLDKYTEAIADFDQAIRLNPNDADAFNNRGISKNNLGKYTEAIADYEQAIRLNPNYAQAFNNRGNSKKNLGKNTEAIADYDQAIRLNPNDAYPFNGRGNAKKELGKYTEAIADYDQAISLKADFPQPYANKGCALVKLGKYGEAIDNIRKAEQINSSWKTTQWAQDCKTEALNKLKD